MKLQIISAGAGSGKTYRLTHEMLRLLKSGVRPGGIMATTFTNKAAAELQERVRIQLLEEGMTQEADQLADALIGTVHSLGVKLLKRFAFEAGLSPQIDIMADDDQQLLFNKALATVLRQERIDQMEALSEQLGLNKRGYYDWRRDVKQLSDIARSNDFSIEQLEYSKQKSLSTFGRFLGKPSTESAEAFNKQLLQLLRDTFQRVEQNEDTTKVTQKMLDELKQFSNRLELQGQLNWHEWVKISKLRHGAKSREDVAELLDYTRRHDEHPLFHKNINDYIALVFDLTIAAVKEYDAYKKHRGLIDYIDMEIQVKRLLDQPAVQHVLKAELDLLMVDEFQDTSPLQLEIFLKLSNLAKHSVWVGDPKQSIYGFRGAEPALMRAIIEHNGGIAAEDIQKFSWRSREDIAFLTNGLFTEAFRDLPKEQIALQPKRCKQNTTDNGALEPPEMGDAIHHWHFDFDGEGRSPAKPWMENAIATSLHTFLSRHPLVFDKSDRCYRPIRPGDVAILCRSNASCLEMAEALHKAGIKAAIARAGLLHTAEARFIIACLKYMLNEKDSLSVAEILLLSGQKEIEEIVDNRLDWLNSRPQSVAPWASENPFIQQLNLLRPQLLELSGAEILNLLLESLDLRRLIARWGHGSRRMDNVDVLRRMAIEYEEACNRLHTAASLGGLLLWLNELEQNGEDKQGSGQSSDAVNVLTYHKSKGLEWPVVICHSLEGRLKDSVWGIDIVNERAAIHIDDILGGRWLRFWVNPYGDQQSGTALAERLDASPEKAAARQKALLEEARLLYVGITRARDYLVFPTRSKPTLLLNRCWHHGDESQPTLDANSDESPWIWEGNPVFKQTEVFSYPRDFAVVETTETAARYLEAAPADESNVSYQPFAIELKNESIRQHWKCTIGNATPYHPPLTIEDQASAKKAAKLLKGLLIADHPDLPPAERATMARDLIDRFELDELLGVKQVLQQSDAFHRNLQEQLGYQKLLRKFPLRLKKEEQLFTTIADFVLLREDGFVLIQNSAFNGAPKKLRAKAKELAGWLEWSGAALEEVFGRGANRYFVHFVTQAVLMEASPRVKANKEAKKEEGVQGKLF